MPNRAITLVVAGLFATAPTFGQEVKLLKEIHPRQGANPGADPTEFVVHGSRVLIGSGAGYSVSDRSGAPVPSVPVGFSARDIVTIGTRVFYVFDAVRERYLYMDDGAGTRIISANLPNEPTPLGNQLLFTSRGELWRSDGTPVGTRRVTEIQPGPGKADVRSLVRGNNAIYFIADDGRSGAELWRTDATAAGTGQLADIRPGALGSSIRHMVTAGSTLWFFADDGFGGDDLWRSDGSPAGTRRVVPATAHPSLTPFGTGALYLQNTPAGQSLWFTDGTPAGTRPLKVVGPATTHTVETRPLLAGVWIYFVVADAQGLGALWRSDGTVQGTTQVTPATLALSLDSGLAAVGPQVYFGAGTGRPEGVELWSTDGTATRMVADIRPGAASSSPTAITAIDANVWFAADDGTHGREPWISDGTTAGTRLVSNIGNWFETGLPPQITRAGDRAWWFVKGATQDTLWSSRGTPNTTQPVAIPKSQSQQDMIFAGAGKVFFTHTPAGATGVTDLWTTDGTAAGTNRLVRQVGPAHDSIDMSTFTLFNGGPLGNRLWRTDGTAAGTRELGADISTFRGFRGQVFDRLAGNVYYPGLSEKLWVTDGTTAGTRIVAATSGFTMVSPAIALQGRMTFLDREWRVVRTDGTPAGTTTSPAIPNVPRNRGVATLGTNSRGWFFALYNELRQPRDLYFFDVAAGRVTHLLNSPRNGIVFGGTLGENLIFRWTTAAEGVEPWISDGTRAGTRLLSDIQLGPGSSYGGIGVATGDRYYYFSATEGHVATPNLFRTDGRSVTRLGTFQALWGYAKAVHVEDQALLFGIHPTLGQQLFAVQLYANTQSLGGGCADANPPHLRVSDPVLGSSTRLNLTSSQPNQSAVAIIGSRANFAARPRLAAICELVVDLTLPVAAVSGRTGPGGTANWRLPIPNLPTLRGLSLATQAAVGTAPTALGTNVSAGIRLSIGF